MSLPSSQRSQQQQSGCSSPQTRACVCNETLGYLTSCLFLAFLPLYTLTRLIWYSLYFPPTRIKVRKSAGESWSPDFGLLLVFGFRQDSQPSGYFCRSLRRLAGDYISSGTAPAERDLRYSARQLMLYGDFSVLYSSTG